MGWASRKIKLNTSMTKLELKFKVQIEISTKVQRNNNFLPVNSLMQFCCHTLPPKKFLQLFCFPRFSVWVGPPLTLHGFDADNYQCCFVLNSSAAWFTLGQASPTDNFGFTGSLSGRAEQFMSCWALMSPAVSALPPPSFPHQLHKTLRRRDHLGMGAPGHCHK